MKPWIKLGTAVTPDHTVLDLIEHDGDYEIRAGGQILMSTRLHHSEEELARLACERLHPGAKVLVGGLGIGYTLRATLDRLPAGATVVQAELVPEIVAWNRGPLGRFAQKPLEDPRVELVIGDVRQVIAAANEAFDAILLDVDNGPTPLVTASNAGLYSHRGLEALRRALRPGGAVAVWSSDPDESFLDRLSAHGFAPQHQFVRARAASGRAHHVIFVGRRPRANLPRGRPGRNSR